MNDFNPMQARVLGQPTPDQAKMLPVQARQIALQLAVQIMTGKSLNGVEAKDVDVFTLADSFVDYMQEGTKPSASIRSFPGLST